MKLKTLYGTMILGGAIGIVAAFIQTLEKIALLKDKDAELACNLNSVFSCTNVLDAPQSSLFGFPNSIMCLVLFTIFFSIGLAGLANSALHRQLRLSIQGLALFTLGFALWFLWQSTYTIGALCLYCIVCFAGLLLVNAAWLRINVGDLPLSSGAKKSLKRAIQKGADLFLWFLLAVVVTFAMLLRFN